MLVRLMASQQQCAVTPIIQLGERQGVVQSAIWPCGRFDGSIEECQGIVMTASMTFGRRGGTKALGDGSSVLARPQNRKD
jgi:hypothetical protein